MSNISNPTQKTILTDRFGRFHNYLRMSITSNCNLKCMYCMPEDTKIQPNTLNSDELFTIANFFVKHGVNKIRITGGEPLIRKDFLQIIEKLSTLPVELAITTNGVLADVFMDNFYSLGIKKINFSLDSLQETKNLMITKRGYLDRVKKNIDLFVNKGFNIKVNCVLIKGVNDNEIIDFVNETKEKNINIRFIEFMPFDGNKWDLAKMVGFQEVLDLIYHNFGKEKVIKIKDKPNDTSKSYQISSYKGTFSIIGTVTNPFCDTCNRIRLTADGFIKNCLFSSYELNIIDKLRKGESIENIVFNAINEKKKVRSGLTLDDEFTSKNNHTNNRSMVSIGG